MTRRLGAGQTKVLVYGAVVFFLIALTAFLWLKEANNFKQGTVGTLDANESTNVPEVNINNLFGQ